MPHPPKPLPPVVTELLKLCEQLYTERCVLETLLKDAAPADWLQHYERALHSPNVRAHAHAIFERVAVDLKQVDNYEETLRTLLLRLPSLGKPN